MRRLLQTPRRILQAGSPAAAAHITWLLWWGLWVVVGARLLPPELHDMYDWATYEGVKGAAGLVPIALGLCDLTLAITPGRLALRARWVVLALCLVWWCACVVAFGETSIWLTSTPSYGIAALLAAVTLYTCKEAPPWPRPNQTCSN